MLAESPDAVALVALLLLSLALLLAAPWGLYLLWRFFCRELWRTLAGAAIALLVLGAGRVSRFLNRSPRWLAAQRKSAA